MKHARFFRYGGLVVRLMNDELRPVTVNHRPVEARKGRYPRAARAYAPLPKRYRREIAAQAEHADRKARLEDQGVEILDTSRPWEQTKVATAA